MKKYVMFQNYFHDENPDPAKDKIFLNNTILMTTDDEFNQFLSQLSGLLMKYNFAFSKGRKDRDISIKSAPEEK